MRLDEQAAEDRLRRMLQPDSPPALTESEVGELLEAAKRTDRWDVWPTQDGWEPTWDLHWAASEGWLAKAAKVAGDFDFTSDGQTLDRGQVHAHCLRMARHYGSMRRAHVREDEWMDVWPTTGGSVVN